VENGVPADMMRLEELLRPLVQTKAPIAVSRKPKTRWVTPQVLVEVDFPNATPGGRLRPPKYKGTRDDLMAKPRRRR
jgi:ATP-dependent DNA ligase